MYADKQEMEKRILMRFIRELNPETRKLLERIGTEYAINFA
jgi:hypothetical protein